MIINTEKSQELQVLCFISLLSLIILFYHQLPVRPWPLISNDLMLLFFLFSHQCITVGDLKWHTIKYTYLPDGLSVLQWSIHSSSPTILWNLSSKPGKTKIKKSIPHTQSLEKSVHRSCWFLFQMRVYELLNFGFIVAILLFCKM